MNKYFVIHTYKGDPEEIWQKMTEIAPGYAVAMAEGKTPARNLKTWNPFPYGRKDYVFCLWEAEKPENILATIATIDGMDYLTADIMLVDETDWAELAAQVKAAMAVAV